ncbi:MAG: c-type cytochrome [Actinobacteria bacterium]|nr:c-type cytochrome [Actinomycetota bacterium]
MPLVIVWFAVFAIGAGTFAVLHGKDESEAHDKEYVKANQEIEKNETTGPFEKAREEAAEEEKAAAGAEGTESAGGEEGGEAAAGGEESTEGESEASTGGGNAEAGAAVFAQNCATCHGPTGHGGGIGPDLRTMPLAQTEEGTIKQVTNGGAVMPPFSGVLSEEEIKNVAAYVVQDITHGE